MALRLPLALTLMHDNSQEHQLLLYAVSHDLRGPLVNLQGFSQEIARACADLQSLLTASDFSEGDRQRMRDVIDGDLAESARFIQTTVGRMTGHVGALERLARAGQSAYQWQAVDVDAAVRQVIDSHAAQVARAGAEIVVGNLPPAWSDPAAVDQVFGNLIANALNYSDPSRPPRIEIGALAGGDEAERNFHAYFVRDNGLGIPTEQAPRITTPFQRLHPDRAPGHGIGLTLVKRAVERHGGRVWFESTVGEGAMFFVSLPTVAAGVAERHQETSA